VPVGFSDHTVEDNTSYAAVLAGACVLEKHFTLHRDGAGPDHFFSLEPAAFRRYIDAARRAETLLGENVHKPLPEEEQVRALARGRLVAARDIRAGEKLTPENLTVQRPGTGISPLRWDEFIGQCVRHDIRTGTPMTDDLLQLPPLRHKEGIGGD
jgi:N,N'-diacetyllegionaminate synthase